jgi:AAA domain
MSAGGHMWIDANGREKVITLRDILVVAPYNAQVAALAQRLPPGARVGTVDRFQGQEASIVIYSMATSSADDAPRGMTFLYSANRLNAATPRALPRRRRRESARVRAGVPHAEQMRLANPFCRFAELAEAPLEVAVATGIVSLS